MKNKRGDILSGCLTIVGTGLFLLLIAAFIYDYHRFSKVSNANTDEQLIVACQEYDMAQIRNVPNKCLKSLNIIK